jgi:CheY-like chemotaxis protein
MKLRDQPLLPVERQASFPPKTVLLVDDRDESRLPLKWFLSISGYVVDSVRSAEDAIAVFQPAIHDMVVTDNLKHGMSGQEMASIIKLRSPDTLVVMYSEELPSDCSCFDLILGRSTNMVVLKMGIDRLFAPL